MAQLGPRWHWTSPRALLAGRDPCNRYLAPGLQPQLLGRDVQGLVRSGSSISICPYVSVSITANPYQTNPKHSIQYSNPDIHSNLFTPFLSLYCCNQRVFRLCARRSTSPENCLVSASDSTSPSPQSLFCPRCVTRDLDRRKVHGFSLF